MYLTNGQFWGGVTVILLAFTALVVGFLGHWKSVDRDILREDRKRLEAWARQHAAEMARRMFREYVENMRINVPVVLVNESDIPWSGEDRKRQDDAA